MKDTNVRYFIGMTKNILEFFTENHAVVFYLLLFLDTKDLHNSLIDKRYL